MKRSPQLRQARDPRRSLDAASPRFQEEQEMARDRTNGRLAGSFAATYGHCVRAVVRAGGWVRAFLQAAMESDVPVGTLDGYVQLREKRTAEDQSDRSLSDDSE